MDIALAEEHPCAPGIQPGVFASPSKARPSPKIFTAAWQICMDAENGVADMVWIDAFDGTALLDIKPYLPMSDREMSAEYPEWLEGFPSFMEEAAAFFSDPENAAKFY